MDLTGIAEGVMATGGVWIFVGVLVLALIIGVIKSFLPKPEVDPIRDRIRQRYEANAPIIVYRDRPTFNNNYDLPPYHPPVPQSNGQSEYMTQLVISKLMKE